MNDRLTLFQVAILSIYSIAMAAGQLLFKAAALRLPGSEPIGERLLSLLHNWMFLLAVALYFALAIFWVWVLSFTPLSRAYPFVALAFATAPLAATVLFAEPLTMRLLVGILAILCGIVLVAG